MRLFVTGGGTGGHIYPAMEIARYAIERGASVKYLGSLRGQEGRIAATAGVAFEGFPSLPLLSLKTPQGWKALRSLVLATKLAKRSLRSSRPDAVFSTGGYGAAPIMAAARSLRIPYTIHEANSVPGRSNRLFARSAAKITSTFRVTSEHLPGVERTGHPIRSALREAASQGASGRGIVLFVGGSQGSQYLNQSGLAYARRPGASPALIVAGPTNYEALQREAGDLAGLTIVPYLESDEMAQAYRDAAVVVGRSGSALAEFAVFRLPSVLVPLPSSADGHQTFNALEFQAMGAAKLAPQGIGDVGGAVEHWLAEPADVETARRALEAWDMPGATQRIVTILEGLCSA